MRNEKIDKEMEEIALKYCSNGDFDIFTNVNRYFKYFIRVNVYFDDGNYLSQTFQYNENGIKKARNFIEKYHKKMKGI